MPGVPGRKFPTDVKPYRINGRTVKKSTYNQQIGLNRLGRPKGPDNGAIIPSSVRRIVNISHLAKELWCKSCNNCLTLEDLGEETRKGLVSKFKIACRACGYLQEVQTELKPKECKYKYPVNLKLTEGMKFIIFCNTIL
jgi:hypothetical protein